MAADSERMAVLTGNQLSRTMPEAVCTWWMGSKSQSFDLIFAQRVLALISSPPPVASGFSFGGVGKVFWFQALQCCNIALCRDRKDDDLAPSEKPESKAPIRAALSAIAVGLNGLDVSHV